MPNGAGGGGGGGIVGVGNSFTGTAQSLEIAGNWIYGYSGIIAINNTETNMIDYLTGNFIAVLRVQFNYAVVSGDDFTYRVRLSETIVQEYETDAATGNSGQPQYPLHIIVPAYTNIKCTAQNAGAASRNQICGVTGRIYRG